MHHVVCARSLPFFSRSFIRPTQCITLTLRQRLLTAVCCCNLCPDGPHIIYIPPVLGDVFIVVNLRYISRSGYMVYSILKPWENPSPLLALSRYDPFLSLPESFIPLGQDGIPIIEEYSSIRNARPDPHSFALVNLVRPITHWAQT